MSIGIHHELSDLQRLPNIAATPMFAVEKNRSNRRGYVATGRYFTKLQIRMDNKSASGGDSRMRSDIIERV